MKRRHFLQALGLSTAALYTADLLAAPAQKKSMALQLFSVRDAVAKDLEGTLERLRKIGYNGLEIYGYNGTFFGKQPMEFKTILKNTGFRVISSHHTTGLVNKAPGTLTDGWEKPWKICTA